PRHSSDEADEQSGRTSCGTSRRGDARSGTGGAKGGDQGECGPAKHAPDSAPGKCVTGAGPHTASEQYSLCRHSPEVGAVCGKAARTDLGGGRAMKRTFLPLQRREFIAGLGTAAACPRVAGGDEAERGGGIGG